ncbi:hypothetical protein HD554DRAFT_2040175 [Boletus coccyginus]|nr:hypothetical protein HD554DRAFT_2040175 [Boletus coccyginus]
MEIGYGQQRQTPSCKTDSIVQRRSTYVKIPSRCVKHRVSRQYSIHGSIRAQKELKPSRARQILEWEEYDEEITWFLRRLVAGQDSREHGDGGFERAGWKLWAPSQTNSGGSSALSHDEL